MRVSPPAAWRRRTSAGTPTTTAATASASAIWARNTPPAGAWTCLTTRALRGYGEKGSLYPDRSFDSYYSGARAAGIDVGVYFFSQAATVQEAAQEALYALQLLDGRDLDLPVYYDWEPVQQEDSRTLHNNEFLLTSQARTFCALIEQGGYEAGVYMNRQQGYYRYDLPSMGNIALWIADPGDYPDFYYRFDVWQYDHGARLDGVNEIVDLNVEFVPVM